MDSAISITDLSKTYRIYGNPWNRLKEKLPWQTKQLYRAVDALKSVTAEIPRGSCVGLIGGNGAGKSTLLKILTGTTYPTGGSFTTRGRVASLLELGAGFNQEFSGKENIFMNAALMGLNRREAQAKYNEILEFSELEEFINAPIRTYSSGMVCRLGFSVATTLDPDILILDEVFAVGDLHFRSKCIERIMDYKERGKTMLFCSHSLYDVRQICERSIWLRKGEVQMFDETNLVTNEYSTYENQTIAEHEASAWDEEGSGRPAPKPVDSGDHAHIVSAELIDPKTGEPRHTFSPREDVAVRVHLKSGIQYQPLHLVVGFHRVSGMLCMAMSTEFDDKLIEAQECIVTLKLPRLPLLSGEFIVPVWLLDERGLNRLQKTACKRNLVIQNRDKELGVFLSDREWEIDVIDPAPTQRTGTQDTQGIEKH